MLEKVAKVQQRQLPCKLGWWVLPNVHLRRVQRLRQLGRQRRRGLQRRARCVAEHLARARFQAEDLALERECMALELARRLSLKEAQRAVQQWNALGIEVDKVSRVSRQPRAQYVEHSDARHARIRRMVSVEHYQCARVPIIPQLDDRMDAREIERISTRG